MKREEIEKLEVGRELDARIAERVMGFKLFRPTPKKNAICGGCRVSSGVYIMTDETHEWGPVVKPIPYYSKYMSDAWKVAEKFESFSVSKKSVGGGYHAHLYTTIADAETAPLAICRSALLAVMENE